MRWCWFTGHKWGKPSEWTVLHDYPKRYEKRDVCCERCGEVLYRQVRDGAHRLVYY